MSKVVINPLTRVSGLLEIEVEVDNNVIVDAKSSGMLFRGFEKILKGRYPLDATYLSERICGICSTAHSVASTKALENAMKIEIKYNDQLIRNFMHGAEFLQNHLRHFYVYALPDFVKGIPMNPAFSENLNDYRLPDELNKKLAEHYLLAVESSRLAHKMIAILGAKAPHNHGIFTGGVTVNLQADIYIELKSILANLKDLIKNIMFEDMDIIAKYYDDYFLNGCTEGNFISYGLFTENVYDELVYVKPGVYLNNKLETFEPKYILEDITHSWFVGEQIFPPLGSNDEATTKKEDAYSFVKAPRYKGFAMETGPLARLWIKGDYRRGISTLDRMMARVIETKNICELMGKMLEQIQPSIANIPKYEIPDEAYGSGFTDTTRGALVHYVHIKDKLIDKYTIITPSEWNLSPMDSLGVHGPAEKALIGTRINNEFLEIGRIVRSFDPCVSCATHIMAPGFKDIVMRVV